MRTAVTAGKEEKTMCINAANMPAQELCTRIKTEPLPALTVHGVNGQRYIAAGLSGKQVTLHGTPGNALGAYLNGACVTVHGNAQDAIGDTMNDGAIVVYGSVGDAPGYAMRGGKIYVQGNAGYRAGIHMKAYRTKQPVLIIGGEAGSFLGEYQAGGTIIVLGLYSNGHPPVGRFVGTGMHGGKMLLRCNVLPFDLPEQVSARQATPQDLAAVDAELTEYCTLFGLDKAQVLDASFFLLEPNSQNPYRQMYCYA
jgi:glutamate synthase domain-containing protein 3